MWEEQTSFYLGEWHFHPKEAPDPSEIDRAGIKGISESPRYRCPEPVLLIIGGSLLDDWRIRAFVFQRNSSLLELYRLD